MILTLLFACSGEPTDAKAPAVTGPVSAVSAALIGQTWQVRLAPDASRAAFEGQASWTAYFQGRRVDALTAVASENNPAGLARMHAELAGMYDEAAFLAANSVVQVYGVDAQPTDPVEVQYLLGEAGVVLGHAAVLRALGLVLVGVFRGWFVPRVPIPNKINHGLHRKARKRSRMRWFLST